MQMGMNGKQQHVNGNEFKTAKDRMNLLICGE